MGRLPAGLDGTGLSGDVQLWDWLEVLALPIALAIAPVLLRHRQRLTTRHRAVVTTVLTLWIALVIAGYRVPWRWTGFTGNTLWDWLELVLLPLVVATGSLEVGRAPPGRGALVTAAIAGVVFAALVAAGYLVPWGWTGFRGNTVWDWIRLLLLPILLPTVVLPFVRDQVTDRVAPESADGP